MRVLLTGANGFLGRHLAVIFLRAGVDLIRVTRKGNRGALACDLTSRRDVERAMVKTSPDLVVHCAAFVPKTLSEYNDKKLSLLNSKMIENILLFTKSPIVYISSMTVYGTSNFVIRRESNAGMPDSLYGESKYAGELLLKKHNRDSLIIRIPGLFGAVRDSGLVSNIVKALIKGKDPSLPDKPILWAAMDVEDAAEIIVWLSINYRFKGYEPINVGYSDIYSINNFLALCEEVFQRTIEHNIIHPEFKFDLTKLNSLRIFSGKTLKDAVIALKDKYE